MALSSADKLADVIINGSAEEISLTRLTREVEEEVDRVRAEAVEPLDEEGVQMRAWQNLKSRNVMSKQMRHDGAIKQKHASVWKASGSLAAAKKELCKTVAEEDLRAPVSPSSDAAAGLFASSGSYRSRRASRGFLGSMLPSFMTEEAGGAPPRESVRSAPMAMKSKRSVRMPEAYPEAARSDPYEEATSVKSNVLVEDEISYEQVQRIMKRKSAK